MVTSNGRPWHLVGCLVLLAATAAGCTPTARTAGPYEAKAAKAAEALHAAVGSDLLVARQALGGRATAAYLSVATSDAEDAATSAASTFLSIQPPGDASSQLREDFADIADEATAALGEARIAARANDPEQLRQAIPGLEQADQQLVDFIERRP